MIDSFPIKVSVVMCTYNGEAFVSEQILSVINQTYPLHELLIFDDASTDKTIEIITALSLKYTSIKVTVHTKNIGFIKNFEDAIKAATGEVIAIADQDDIWINTKLEKMIKGWKKEHLLIYCNSSLFVDTPPRNPQPSKHIQFEGMDARRLFLTNTISGHNILLKKELVPLIVPFEEGVMYDWWIAVVAAYNGGVQHYDEILVMHRSHASNITVNAMTKFSKAEQILLHKKLLIKQTKKFITAPNVPPTHKEFLKEYTRLMEESLSRIFYVPLFLFILKNRYILLNNKKRKVSIISNIKHSYQRTYTPKNAAAVLLKE